MTRTIRHFTVLAAFLLWCGSAWAANFAVTDTFSKEYPIDPDGAVWIENPIGNIEIVGSDSPAVSLIVKKLSRGVDQAAIAEAREQTNVLVTGDNRMRILRTVIPPVLTNRWTTFVSYTLRVPRTAHVKIASNSSERIRIVDIGGDVTVKNVNGLVVLESVTGSAIVDSANGSIHFDPNGKPAANVQLSTINGQIEVVVAPNANFRWIADTFGGDFLTTLPVNGHFVKERGALVRTRFVGVLNSSHGPTISTATMMGNVFLLKKGTTPNQARSVREPTVGDGDQPPISTGRLLSRVIQLPLVQGDFVFATKIGNVNIGQIRGNTRIETGAGEVHLGSVLGGCTVISQGGPLDFGDLFGVVNAETKAGDIAVRAARAGGTLTTGGGVIRVLYGGAEMKLRTGGGDIFVRQASGPVFAETRSGDITINVEPVVRTQPIEARTLQGNIVLNVNPRFAADVEAIVVTSEQATEPIRTDFTGLTIQRERIGGGRTRVRLTGKVNGGGERVLLYAEEGDIQISAQSLRPLLSPAQ